MFSQQYCDEIDQYFNAQMTLLENRCRELEAGEPQLPSEMRNLCGFSRTLLENKIEEINTAVDRCSQDEGEALRFLYSAMPLSDMLDYPAALYLSYARHGAFLWKEGPFAGRVPEKLFANYVLHHRVHNEDIADTRSFFYDRLIERVEEKDMYAAAWETNFWCAEKATYRTTFRRTQNPLTMYGTGAGRCGEEAPFAATALRSVGIPAREVAAPWWAHCDDNHAWIEAWCDGKWHFMGGCEPDARLDQGWFAGPATRAMLIDSAWFGKDAPLEPIADHRDMSVRLNHLSLYAPTAKLQVSVKDEDGDMVPDARVEFAVLNYGRFSNVATLRTGRVQGSGDYGRAALDTGMGDLLVSAYREGRYGEKLVSLRESDVDCTIVLRQGLQETDRWRNLDIHAPKETPDSKPATDAELAVKDARLEKAAESRRERAGRFYQGRAGERVLLRFAGRDREAVEEILRQACGNMGEIVRFLEWDFAGKTVELERQYGQEIWKLKALKTLAENDYWDIRAEVLAECCIWASPYAPLLPEEVFFPYLLCPTVAHEFPRAVRAALFGALGGELSCRIRNNPGILPELLKDLVISLPEQEYANLVNSSTGCLTGGMGSGISRDILCVNIYRCLGIPARIRLLDGAVEYYNNDEAAFCYTGREEKKGEGTLVLHFEKSLKPEERKHYSLARFENGRFTPLFIGKQKKKQTDNGETGSEKENAVELCLEQGLYRAVTTNRLPGGGQLAKVCDFELHQGETKEMELSLRAVSAEAMLERMPVEDMILEGAEGEKISLHSLGKGRKALLLWLELTREPTEHILNELWEKRESFGRLRKPEKAEASGEADVQSPELFFVIKKGKNYGEDVTLNRTLQALPHTVLLFDEFGDRYEKLARETGQEPGRLPLAMILEDGKECIYSDSGYNVGMADTLMSILTD